MGPSVLGGVQEGFVSTLYLMYIMSCSWRYTWQGGRVIYNILYNLEYRRWSLKRPEVKEISLLLGEVIPLTIILTDVYLTSA